MRKRIFKKANKGSMLLECVAAMFILITICTIFVSINKGDFRSFRNREDMRSNNILMSNIINELKFNVKIENLKDRFINDEIVLNVGDGLTESLKVKNILELNGVSSNKVISIKKVEEKESDIKMNIILREGEEELLKEEVLKSVWMEKKKE
ncbi:hypothetical protein [Clostridium sp.]|uniref:hypothetical protein n=1 Tax=Clostridium sp. TaxID=1506 RepID=UPI002FC7F647